MCTVLLNYVLTWGVLSRKWTVLKSEVQFCSEGFICLESWTASDAGEALQSGTRGCDKLQFCPPRMKASCLRVLGSSEWCHKMLSTLKNYILELLVCTQLTFMSHTEPGCCSAKLFGSVLQLFLFTQGCLAPRQRLGNETPFPLRDPHCLISQTFCSEVISTTVSSLEWVNTM